MRPLSPDDAVKALAEVWAGVDGKIEQFRTEADLPPDDPQRSKGGYYDGYMIEAKEMIKRLEKRGFVLVPEDWLRG